LREAGKAGLRRHMRHLIKPAIGSNRKPPPAACGSADAARYRRGRTAFGL